MKYLPLFLLAISVAAQSVTYLESRYIPAIEVTVPTVDPTKIYQLQSTTNLEFGPWENLGQAIPGGNNQISVIQPAVDDIPRFFRVAVLDDTTQPSGTLSVVSPNGSGLVVDSSGTTIITRNFDVETAVDQVKTAVFRNTSEVTGLIEDYQNQVMVWLQAGTKKDHRAYFVWANYLGQRKWMMGRNADGEFILYNTESNHRFYFPNEGDTWINSDNEAAVEINRGLRFDGAGTGGFVVWSGGDFATNLVRFKVFSDGNVDVTGNNLQDTVLRIGGQNPDKTTRREWAHTRRRYNAESDQYDYDLSPENYKGSLTLLTTPMSRNLGIGPGMTNPAARVDIAGSLRVSDLATLGPQKILRSLVGPDYQITTNDYYIASSQTSVKTLPSAPDAGSGFSIVIKSLASAKTTVTVHDGATVENSTTDTLNPGQSARYVWDGTSNWEKIGQ